MTISVGLFTLMILPVTFPPNKDTSAPASGLICSTPKESQHLRLRSRGRNSTSK